jgi:plastocyanin
VIIKPFSLWTLAVWGLAFFFAGFLSGRHGSDFPAAGIDLGSSPIQSTQEAVQPPAIPASSASGATSATAESNAPAVTHVAMKDMKFSPATIEIKKGDTVEWKNDDMTPHTATSPTFDSGPVASDASWRHTFGEAGSFPYTCTFHPDMKGTVVVK